MLSIKTNIITLLILILLSNNSQSQVNNFPKNIFRAPVDFTMTLSGNFAELRNNHFHAGIDIRTFTIGKKIYSIHDGFVSRIRVSSGGYGKAIYIDHPNGFTSVYAHLDRFNDTLDEFVKSHQYKTKSFEFDIDLDKNQFPVKKGEVIAISGNTGSSAGPHLHFEIRDTKTEHPLNPLFFGFKIKDTTHPKIFDLCAYPLDSLSAVNGKNVRKRLPVTFYNNAFHLKGDPKISLAGNVGFALHTNDYLDNTWGKCGIYRMILKVNDSLMTDYSFQRFSYDDTRYINSHMDYSLNVTKNKRIHKCFRDKNNQLSIKQYWNNNGVYNFKDGVRYKIDFEVYDAKGNKSKLRVYANGVSNSTAFPQEPYHQLMDCKKENQFSNENIELNFPENSFYNDLKFQYSKRPNSNFVSDIHSVHKKTEPVHNYYTLAIKTNREVADKNKLFIGSLNKTDEITNVGGVYVDGWVKSKTRVLGDFAIVLDTIAPKVKANTNFKLKSLRSKDKISFQITDKLSGIKSYEGTVNGKWVLFEYDAKNDHLFYKFDKKRLLPNKKHELVLTVTDKVGNKKRLETNFFW